MAPRTASAWQLLLWLTNCCALAALSAGCSKSPERFVPAEDTARAAVVAAMNAWKDGLPPGEVPRTKPVVHLTDSHRKDGQTLVDFEVLGQVPGNADRCFAVRLQLANPDAEERIRYVVVGIDPLWVFRHEDYDMLMHWEHPMEEKAAAEPSAEAPSGSSELLAPPAEAADGK